MNWNELYYYFVLFFQTSGHNLIDTKMLMSLRGHVVKFTGKIQFHNIILQVYNQLCKVITRGINRKCQR